jgi:hypothetical protein
MDTRRNRAARNSPARRTQERGLKIAALIIAVAGVVAYVVTESRTPAPGAAPAVAIDEHAAQETASFEYFPAKYGNPKRDAPVEEPIATF